SSRNRYNYLSKLSEDDALERMKEVLNDENSDNNGNRNNDRNSSNNGNNNNDGNNSSEGGENHGC
ncbi:ATP-dependent nuclease subunit B-like protein, partial [human gut metagenome]